MTAPLQQGRSLFSKALLLTFCLLPVACGRPPDLLSDSGAGAFEVSHARFEQALALVWHDNRHGNNEIYMRVLDGQGQTLSPERRLSHSPAESYEASAAALGDRLAVAWYEKHPQGDLQIWPGLWTLSGEAVWQQAISPPRGQARVPRLLAVGEELFLAWVEDQPGNLENPAESHIMAAWFDAQGNALGEPVQVHRASRTTWNLNAWPLTGSQVALVFDAAFETRASELYLAHIQAQESQVMRLTEDDGHNSKYPDIGVSISDQAAITWFDARNGSNNIHLAMLPYQALRQTEEPVWANFATHSQAITDTPGDSIGAYLAWQGEYLGLAWNDDVGGEHDVYFQAFQSSGTPLGPIQQVTQTPKSSRIPAISAWDGGFFLSWNEAVLSGSHGADSRSEIHGRFVALPSTNP